MAELHGFVKCIKCTTHQKSSNILKPWKLFGNVGLTAKQCVFMCVLVKGEKSEKPWVTEAPEGPFAKKISLFLKINFLPPFYTALCWQSLFDGMPLFLENPTVYEKDMGSFCQRVSHHWKSRWEWHEAPYLALPPWELDTPHRFPGPVDTTKVSMHCCYAACAWGSSTTPRHPGSRPVVKTTGVRNVMFGGALFKPLFYWKYMGLRWPWNCPS